MSEEEKKAIDILKDFTENEDTEYCYDWDGFNYKTILSAIECLLNLIDKQKEQIERLKNAEEYAKLGKETLLDTIHKQQEEIDYYKKQNEIKGKLLNTSLNETRKHCISKDKIREKIKKLEEEIKQIEQIDIGIGFTLGEEWKNKKATIQAYKDLLKEK